MCGIFFVDFQVWEVAEIFIIQYSVLEGLACQVFVCGCIRVEDFDGVADPLLKIGVHDPAPVHTRPLRDGDMRSSVKWSAKCTDDLLSACNDGFSSGTEHNMVTMPQKAPLRFQLAVGGSEVHEEPLARSILVQGDARGRGHESAVQPPLSFSDAPYELGERLPVVNCAFRVTSSTLHCIDGRNKG